MALKSKQDQSTHTHINDYERSKMLRVQENQERLRELGVKNIAKSFTSLVQSQKTKKRKKKPSTDKDVVYTPDFGGDSEEDYNEEVATRVRVPQKQRRPRYIAPMSINRLANLSKKQRVIAPNISRLLPLEESFQRNGHFADANSEKRKRLQQCEVSRDRNGKFIETNAEKRNHFRETMTMGEVILNKIGSQNLAKPRSMTTSISSGVRRKLFIVDNDGEEEGDVRSQDLNGADREANCEKYDENEDIRHIISENTKNGIDWGDVRSEDINEVDEEQYGDEDDNIDDIEQMMRFENDHNGVQDDDSADDLEIEDDEFVQEQHEGRQLEKEGAISTIKKRGPTMMHDVQVRKFNEREVIICNVFGQPIGPVTAEKDTVGRFSRFLGTIARNYSYAPLIYKSWHKVPHKEKMWEYVLEKYIVPDNAKSWVLKSIGACWRGYKCRLKKKHFYKFEDNKTRWKNRPKRIPEKDFLQLLSLWKNKEVMKRCSLLRDVRVSQKNMHTAGPKSFARIHEEMKNEDPNKESPNLTKMFERTRKRTEGNVYVDTYDDTAKKLEQMKNYKPPEDGSAQIDPYLVVMSKEYDGHRRLYGRGVTNKLIKKMNGSETSYMVPQELMESLKASVDAEKSQLADMRRELEVDHERKKAELEAMRKDIDNQRDKLVEDAVQKLLEKLPPGVAQEFLT